VTRVLLVSDDTIFSLGLASLVASESSFELLGIAHDRAAVWDALANSDPDVIVLDEDTLGSNGLCGDLTARHPRTPVLVFARAQEQDDGLLAAVRAGARGYVVKTSDSEHLTSAIKCVASGHGFLDPSVTLRVISWVSRTDHPSYDGVLSPREMEVLGYVIDGEPNKRIARRMGLTENTVKTYLQRAYKKLDCHTRSAAAATLARNGHV